MTEEKLDTYLKYLASQGALDQTGLSEHIAFCKSRGLNDFWCAAPWSWTTRPVEMTIGATSGVGTLTGEGYELPDDFRGIRSVRHRETIYGGAIEYYPPEQFNRQWPNPAGYTASSPILCTSFYDREEGLWYLAFNRPPESGTVIYIDMYTTVGKVDTVPDGFESGLMASIERYLYKPGSNERFSAQAFFEREVVRLQAIDSPFLGHLTQILQPPRGNVEEEGVRSWFG